MRGGCGFPIGRHPIGQLLPPEKVTTWLGREGEEKQEIRNPPVFTYSPATDFLFISSGIPGIGEVNHFVNGSISPDISFPFKARFLSLHPFLSLGINPSIV